MLSIKTIILFLLLLSVIAVVHEFGHLVTAKLFGVYCKEFAIGMGPKICSKKYKETEYSLRALPIGGFVSMVGEQEDDPDIQELNLPKNRTLKGIAKWKQVIIMFAGIFMNFVLAWIIYSLLILNIGSYSLASKPVIAKIDSTLPAYNSGLQVNDIIEKVELSNGLSIKPSNYNELTNFLVSYYHGEGNWTITVNRDNLEYTYDITPTYYQAEDRYIIGITFSDIATKTVDVNFFNCFKYGFIYMCQMLKMVIIALSTIFKGIGLKNMSGPIGVYEIVEETVQYGFDYYIELMALISVNVAAFNAIPVPAFDGGRALLLLIEVIIRRPLSKKFETIILAASWVLIISFMIFVSYNDIIKIIGG